MTGQRDPQDLVFGLFVQEWCDASTPSSVSECPADQGKVAPSAHSRLDFADWSRYSSTKARGIWPGSRGNTC